ncbi:MAG: DNA primase [Gammaproteobacteria bacterium]|nr:DNA primase [Gammaproteobacteria bacterium]
MAVAELLARLSKVKQTRRDTWVAICPAHDDTRPSLAIRALADGRTLLCCPARQCDVEDIVGAVGLQVSELFPERTPSSHYPPVRSRWPAADLLKLAGQEAMLAGIAALMLVNDAPVSDQDRQRNVDAASRLLRIADEAA